MPRPRLAPLVLCLCACAGPSSPRAATTAPESTAPASTSRGGTAAPEFLGLALGADASALRAQHPEFERSSDGDAELASGELTVAGLALRTRLTLYEDRLALVWADATQVTLEDYRRLLARLEEELGPSARSVCTSEVGPPLEQYLASGRGGLRATWDDGRVRASVTLSPNRASGPQLSVHAELVELADRHRPDPDSFKRGRKKDATARCPEVEAVRVEAAGFRFGDSVSTVRAQLGASEPIDRVMSRTPHRIAGVEGELITRFWDGCLAEVMFLAPGAIESYRALQQSLLAELDPPERREQCSASGEAPTLEEITASNGSLRTAWVTPSLHASVRLSAGTGRGEPPQIVLELSTPLLDGRAPRVDFAEP